MEETTETLYVGSELVEQTNIVEDINLASVLYESGRTEDFTIDQWEAVKSTEKYEGGEVALRKFGKAIEGIYTILLDEHADLNAHSWILDRVGEKVGVNYRDALAALFGEIDPRVIPLAKIEGVLEQERIKNEAAEEEVAE